MCRRLWAFLLRLYPSDFRREYGDQFVQLCQDRWQSENGIFRRSRLICDLLADSVAGVPRAWWIHETRQPVSIAVPQGNGVPAFRMFESTPLNPAFVALGAVLSFSALFILMFVVNHARAVQPSQNGNLPSSPIESVMQHLNRPINTGIGPTEDAAQRILNAGAADDQTTNSRRSNAVSEPLPKDSSAASAGGGLSGRGMDKACNGCQTDASAVQPRMDVVPPLHQRVVLLPRTEGRSERAPVVIWPERQRPTIVHAGAKQGTASADCTPASDDLKAKAGRASQVSKEMDMKQKNLRANPLECPPDSECYEANATRPCTAPAMAPPARTPAQTATRSHRRAPR